MAVVCEWPLLLKNSMVYIVHCVSVSCVSHVYFLLNSTIIKIFLKTHKNTKDFQKN